MLEIWLLFILVFNHFEIELIDSFGEKADGRPPPVVALTAACSQEYWGEESHFKLDYLRFWATGEGMYCRTFI